MEKERFFANPDCPNWQPAMNCGGVAEQLPFFNLNWDQSALSSLVSSPASASPPAADGVVMRELIGRLGTICNSGEISPPMSCVNGNATASTSCYNSPLNSPPKLNLPMMDQHHWQLLHPQSHGGTPAMHSAHMTPFSADPGFAERAARFSCFGGRNYNALPGQFGLPEAGNISRVSSSQSLKATGSQVGISERGRDAAMPIDGEFKNSSGREESSVSDPNGGPGDSSNPRKRKGAPKGKGKETPLSSSPKDSSKVEDEDSSAKRSRSTEGSNTEKDVANKPKVEQHGSTTTNGYGGQKQGKENHAKPPEPPKDYIHVRARRGQATDSHSLAERVRREKISERMKFLQDLVPGCNKVTGKAVMLDEIINYVQSLQKQVEFLSMKLATVNPRADFNMDSFLPKDIHQPRGPLTHLVYPMETAAEAFSYVHQPQQGTPLQSVVTNGLETQCSVKPLDPNLRQTLCMQLPALDGFGEAASQLGNFWEDDLQSVVQMGFVQNQEAAFSSQSFHGSVPTAHMKIEL